MGIIWDMDMDHWLISECDMRIVACLNGIGYQKLVNWFELSLFQPEVVYPIVFAHKSTSKDLILHGTIGHDSLQAWLRDFWRSLESWCVFSLQESTRIILYIYYIYTIYIYTIYIYYIYTIYIYTIYIYTIYILYIYYIYIYYIYILYIYTIYIYYIYILINRPCFFVKSTCLLLKPELWGMTSTCLWCYISSDCAKIDSKQFSTVFQIIQTHILSIVKPLYLETSGKLMLT